MNRKILVSILVIGVVAAVAGGSTFALFNDTETSSGNTFTAGELDLKIDWNESYNGEHVEEQNLTDNPGPIFDISDIKPGDEGEATVSLHVYDNPAYVDMNLTQTANFENGCSEPESEVDNSCADPGAGEGELGENLYFTVWNDDGDNIHQDDEEVYFNGSAEELDAMGPVDLDGNSETEGIQPFENSTTEYVGIKWNVPRSVGNEIQTDSKEFNFTFHAEQARHNEPGNTTDPDNETEESVNETDPDEELETTVNVMKHVCDESIQNLSDFNQVDGPDAGNTTEFHDKVLACPTVVQEGDNYSNNSVNFGEKRDFNFEVASSSGVQHIDDSEFVQQKLNESDIGIDVNGDGDMTDALDTSLYVYTGVTEGLVNVTETETPGETRPGALEFTPDTIMQNDDDSTLLENQDVFADDSTIELNTSLDSEDDTVTLHVYNFQNVDDEDPENDGAAISFVSFCVENGDDNPGTQNGNPGNAENQTASQPCPDEEQQLVKFEWTGNSFEPEGGDAMNISINATEFKDNDPTEPVEADWTSEQEISTAVVKSALDICNFSGGINGTVESCGPPPGQQ